MMGGGHSTHDPLPAWGHARLGDGALEHARPEPGAGDPLGDVAHKHVHHRVGHLGAEHRVQRRAAEGEEQRDSVPGVHAGGRDDVEFGHLICDALDAGR